MEKLYLKRKTGTALQRAARVEADRAVLVVGQLRERVRQLNLTSPIRPCISRFSQIK
jgi:hypothetical protein